jgi:EAL domain-containing protein (putative c-di-GMP-specific phosphodiesterase class I)/GGDEF domain-containing protein
VIEAEPTSGEPLLFLLSFRQRDELATLAANAGWRVVAARRSEGAEARFRASGASVAVIDARGAGEDGLNATRALAGDVEAVGAALLVLISHGDSKRLGDFLDAGATHFAVSPLREAELVQTLRYAARHAERVGGWHSRTLGPTEPLGWRFDPALKSLQVTPALAGLLGISETPRLRVLLGRIEHSHRQLLHAALLRLTERATSTAFAHDLAGVGRVVEHLQLDTRTGRIHALVEPLGAAPDASVVVRDALTGVHDAASARRWIGRRLEHGMVHVALVSLVRFETINTAYGREAGDALLRAASKRVGEATREALGRGTLVARIGGSEFLVASEEDVAPAVARVEEALARPFVIGDMITPLSARIATAHSERGDDASTVLRRVSDALHDPQGIGREAGASLDRLALDLRRALDRNEIAVRFQPQVAMATGEIVGVEALARWLHPQRGQLGAETLFAAAQRADLEVAVSAHVQQQALKIAARWPKALQKLRLSINVTAADVAKLDFADSLLAKIDASGFPRGRLTVEITESGLIEDLAQAARLLSNLRTAGCRVAIDDFGTGYSSLAYLKALPLDYLKIDKRLSQDIEGSARDRVVVRGVIDMARSLGLAVIAEGVETELQLELLAKEGCQYYQGFLCAGALDVPALAALVASR